MHYVRKLRRLVKSAKLDNPRMILSQIYQAFLYFLAFSIAVEFKTLIAFNLIDTSGGGEVDLDHLVHGEVGLCDRAVGVQEEKLEHGGLHLVGCPVDDSGNLSPLSGQWIGSSACPDLRLVGAEPVDASPAVCPSRHGDDRRHGPPLLGGFGASFLCPECVSKLWTRTGSASKDRP